MAKEPPNLVEKAAVFAFGESQTCGRKNCTNGLNSRGIRKVNPAQFTITELYLIHACNDGYTVYTFVAVGPPPKSIRKMQVTKVTCLNYFSNEGELPMKTLLRTCLAAVLLLSAIAALASVARPTPTGPLPLPPPPCFTQ